MHQRVINEKGNGKVEISYAPFSAGCVGGAALFMTLFSLLGFYLLLEDHGLSVLAGMVIVPFCTLFFGIGFLIIMRIVLTDKIIFTIDPSGLKNRKGKRIRFEEIEDIYFGWHNHRFSGMVFQDLVFAKTKNKKFNIKKRFYIRTYNLLFDDEIDEILKKYVFPNTKPSVADNWAERKGRKKPENADE